MRLYFLSIKQESITFGLSRKLLTGRSGRVLDIKRWHGDESNPCLGTFRHSDKQRQMSLPSSSLSEVETSRFSRLIPPCHCFGRRTVKKQCDWISTRAQILETLQKQSCGPSVRTVTGMPCVANERLSTRCRGCILQLFQNEKMWKIIYGDNIVIWIKSE